MKKAVNFYFINKTSYKIPKRYFFIILKKFLSKMHLKNPIEISLILIKEKKIKEINKKYRKKDKATDVLSFPIDLTKKENIKKFKKDDKIILGDIFICPQYIEKEYKIKNKKNFFQEIENNFLHGLMHLLGYDHKNKKEEKIFSRIADNILQ